MARRKNDHRLEFQRGNRAYSFSYALGSMKSNPFRSISLALTLSLGVALIASVMIWSDTGIQVSVDNYFENTPFQMVIEDGPGNTEEVYRAESFAANNQFIESTHRVNSTVGLVWGTRLPNNTIYGLDEPIYTNGMKDCEVLFVDPDFLEASSSSFQYDGKFELGEGDVLVSRQFIHSTFSVFDISLSINSTIDIELLTQRASTSGDQIGLLGRVSLESLRIVGIYEIGGFGSLIETSFPSILRSNYDFVNYDTPVLGIRDSIMILSNQTEVGAIADDGFFGATAFIRASGEALLADDPTKIATNLLILKARLDEQFTTNIEGLNEVLYLQRIVDTYMDTAPLALLNLPVFILALFLSIYAADSFMATRTTEVGALRSKGASSTQIYGVFLSESVLMAVFSIGFGLILSVAAAALIPSAISFMTFDLESYMFYLFSTVLKPETILYSILICILPPMLFILQMARKTAKTEIGSTLVEVSETVSGSEAHGFTLGVSIALLGMVLLSVLFFTPSPSVVMLELALGTAAWFFLAYNGSRIARVGFSRISARLSFMLGEKNLIAAGNLRMRKGRIVPLMVVLTLTFSATIAFAIQAYSFQADLEKEVEYALGADLRIECANYAFDFNDTLETYPGINRATPVMRTWGMMSTESITLEGIDPIDYSLIGLFDETSFFGEDSTYLLSRLAAIENGIILSEYHADRLNKTVGNEITLDVGARLDTTSITFVIVGLVHSAPGFGYASIYDIPPSRLGSGFGYQAGYSGFALTNIGFLSEATEITTATTFLADLVCITDQDFLMRALADLPGVSAITPDKFDLKTYSFGTALFLSTVEGLFSIGFMMSLLLGMFALTLFLGSVVRERKRDYAILRAVGGSRQQIIYVVFSEFAGIVFASLMFSLLLGTVFGFIMSIIVFSMSPFSRVLQPAMVFPTGFLTVILLIEIILMIVGAYLPARQAAKTDPAIVLRNL